MNRKLLVFACNFVLIHGLFAQQTITKNLSRKFDGLLEQRDAQAPGAIVMASLNGKPFYQKAVGLANVELQAPLTVDAVFEAASVSKQFTATAVLRLVEEGKLNLADDIRTYFPELPDYGQVITIKHLLTMTSGLRDWRNITYLMGKPTYEHVYTQDEAFEIICKQQGLNFMPGEQYSYCNSNYDLLSMLVSRITGEPFIDYATREVLARAGLEGTRWRDDPYAIVDNKVQAYNKIKDNYVQSPVLEKTHGAAGLLVNAGDLIKWADYWGASGFGESVGSLRTQLGVLNNGDTITYACGGVWVKQLAGFTEVAHSGLLGGFRAWVAHYPEVGLSVSYLTNDKSFSLTEVREQVSSVLEILSGPPVASEKKPLTPALLSQLPGHYRNVNGYQVTEIKKQDSVLTLAGDTLYRLSADTLVLGSQHYVVRDSLTLELVDSDDGIVYRKAPLPSVSQQQLNGFAGTYTCPDIDLTLRLEVVDGGLKAYRKPYDGVKLFPAYEANGEVGYYGFLTGLKTVFRFSRDAYGQPVLHVSIPRAENFRFNRHINL